MDKTGIYFIYDGECPLCTSAAQVLRIQKVHGPLHLINARETKTHPLMQEINQRKLNLDDGMVIYANNLFHHGADALSFIARYADPSSLSMRVCKFFFCSNTISSLLYPGMRSIRNWLLRRRNIKPLNNLSKDKAVPKTERDIQDIIKR